jgi:hypothetical protein
MFNFFAVDGFGQNKWLFKFRPQIVEPRSTLRHMDIEKLGDLGDEHRRFTSGYERS